MNTLQTIGAAAVIALAGVSSVQAEGLPFRITLNTGPNHVRNIALEEFVTTLAERTEGELDVQVFSSGQLYKRPDVPKALAQGAAELAAFRARLVEQQDDIVKAVRMDPDFVARAAAALAQ